MNFGKGYRPDPPSRRYQHDARMLLNASSPPPPSVSLVRFAPPVMNQGQSSACTAHAAAVCIYAHLGAAGSPLPFVPSPRGIYAVTRAYERGVVTSVASALPPLEDAGAFPADVMESVSALGVRPIVAPTSDGRYSDVEPANVNDEPRLADVEDDLLHLVTGQYRVTGDAPSIVGQARELLAQGIPLFVGTYVDQRFERWTPDSGPVGVPDYSSPGGGHALAVIGYYTDPAGRANFIVRNSWGEGWGDAGNVPVTDGWLAACSDIYAMRTALAAP